MQDKRVVANKLQKSLAHKGALIVLVNSGKLANCTEALQSEAAFILLAGTEMEELQSPSRSVAYVSSLTAGSSD